MVKINADHDCVGKKCKGETLDGLKIECNRCEKQWLLECLINENEIYELIKAIGIITLKVDDAKGKVQTVATVTEEKTNILNTIIGKESPIEYVCLTCKKKEGSTRNKLKQMETAMERMNRKIQNEKEKYIEQQKTIENLNQTINENQKTINELTQAIEEKDQLIEQNKTRNTVMIMSDDDENDGENDGNENGQNNMKNMIKKTVAKQMKIETLKLTQAMNETIVNECKKIKETISVQSGKERRNVTFDDKILMREDSEIERNIQFDPKLVPTKQMNINYNEKKVYEIYISKFEFDKTIEDIEQHITSNTNFNTQTFTIEEIRSSSSSGRAPNYKAFKIMTLKREIYDEIMDIWAPHYKAREFKQNTNERRVTTTNTYHEQPTNIYNRTPNKSYNMKTNDTRYETNNQNRQFTPNKKTSYNRFEQNRTPNNDKYERNFTPENHEFNTERRETGRQYNRQSEQQHRTQQMNKQSNFSNFLDNKQQQQFRKGVDNKYQQGGYNQYNQGRTQNGMR